LIARAVHASPEFLDDPVLAHARHRLVVWSRLAPHLVAEEREVEIALTQTPVVGRLVAEVLALDDDPATSHRVGDDLAAGLEDPDPDVRREADVAARSVARRRAAVTAPVLLELSRLQGADDAERGLTGWRARSALIEGTTPERLNRLAAGISGAAPSHWLTRRQALCGSSFADRRVLVQGEQRTLMADTALACAVLADVSPPLREFIAAVPSSVVAGSISECIVDGDRLIVSVAHRGTPRSTLMTAHEIGHAVHALASAGRLPPGTLVGEAIACLAAVLVGDVLAADSPRGALAFGDHLIEEVHLSAAASRFEDAVHDTAAVVDDVAALDALWLTTIRAVYEPAVSVPADVGTDWARHPSFVASPGHALSYVWANLFALTVVDRRLPDLADRLAEAMCRGAVDADEFLAIFGIEPDDLLDSGLRALDHRFRHLADTAFAEAAFG
jgi:hypothetical protein